MSKRSKEKKTAPLADWEVSLSNAEGVASGWHHIPASRWKRTGKKGCCFYTFTDEQGVVAEFPPGVVLSVVRKDATPPVGSVTPDGRVLTEDGWQPGGPTDSHGLALGRRVPGPEPGAQPTADGGWAVPLAKDVDRPGGLKIHPVTPHKVKP